MPTPHWQKISGSLNRLIIWILILGTWEAAYRIIGWRAWIFPAPTQVVDSVLGMLNIHTAFGDPVTHNYPWPKPSDRPDTGVFRSELIEAILVSGARLLAGFTASILLGAVLGILMWRFKSLDEFLGPVFLGMQTLPSVCWVPLAIICFPRHEEFAVQSVLIMGSFFAIAISLRDGLRTIPPLYQRAGLMLGADSWKLYRYVLLPASMPALASGLRQGFSFAWRSLMGAEFVFSIQYHGLGFLLQAGRDFNDVAQVISIMIVMVFLGMLVDRLAFAKLEEKIYKRFGLTTVK